MYYVLTSPHLVFPNRSNVNCIRLVIQIFTVPRICVAALAERQPHHSEPLQSPTTISPASMAALHIPMRPLTRLKPLLRQTREWKLQKRCISVQQLPGFEREEMAPFRKTFRRSCNFFSCNLV